MQKIESSKKLSSLLWDLWCLCSVVGIWPRWIEPQLINITSLHIPIQNLPHELKGLHIVAFSDLHMRPTLSSHFLDRLKRKIQKLNPDMILFVGDFICYTKLDQPDRLLHFFNSLQTPYGCYAVLGNHDYSANVSINSEGYYDIVDPEAKTFFNKAWQRLTTKCELKKAATDRVKTVGLHQNLISLIASSTFTLLDNETKLVPVKGSYLNVTGLGEYVVEKCLPEQAFKNYDNSYPGIILLHNPDGFPLLRSYPGNLVISGHTHGGQINLPWLGDKLTMLENPRFKKGLFHEDGKYLYVNRGIGSVVPFRWFASPELVSITLEPVHD